MKKLVLILALAVGYIATAQGNKGVTITVTIENVLKDGGTVLASLHTVETFMRNDGITSASAPGVTGEVTLTFENVTPGTYAIMVMHDVNDNQQMDREANGMPKEDYGMTGEMNPYGPPVFDDAKFEVTNENQEIKIRF